MQNLKTSDIIKTIDDDEEVEDFSEESDAEHDFQPTKQKNKKQDDFDSDFQFASTAEEYNKDSWNDLTKYIKRKAKSKTDDKIKKVRGQVEAEDGDELKIEDAEQNSEVSLSDDELKHDSIKVKEKKKRKRKIEDAADEENKEKFFEDIGATQESVTFYEMNLSRPLMKAIGDIRYVHPTPIQAATIPVALLGRDICGCAATGTGKTAAYMLPTLERLLYRPINDAITRVLVLVPTRELGVQVYQVSKQLAQHTNIEIGLSVGGLDLKVQENVLRRNPDVVIATPGRLIDHIKGTVSFGLDAIEILILDEADRMLDEYFAEQMKEIIKQCSRTRQTLLFSATMSDEVEDLAAVSLVKPVRIFVDSNKNVAFNLRQEFIRIRTDKEADREAILSALVCRTFRSHCIVFVQTKKQAHRLHVQLGLLGVKVAELHGNLTQPQRLEALQKFKNEEVDVLMATDVAARGLDITGVRTVINFIMPATLEHYIHRVGRTARAGKAGVSVSLAGEQERKVVKEIIKRATNPVKNRMIPPDIIEKYKGKLEKVEPQVEQILREEHEERLLSKVENQVNKAERELKGGEEAAGKRPWFQSNRERKEEKKRLALPKATDKNSSKKQEKKQRKAKETPENRVQAEIQKLALVQARLAKRKSKAKKMYSSVMMDDVRQAKTAAATKRKQQSNFADDLWDTSRKNAKRLRHESNSVNKNKGKKQGGKAFGKPQAKKQMRKGKK